MNAIDRLQTEPQAVSRTETVAVSASDLRKLHRVKVAARLALGLVWFWEGLVPKILFPTLLEIDMVKRSGWWWHSPEATLFGLGVAMMGAGLGIMSGIKERLAVAIASWSLLVLMVLVIVTNPAALHDPFGGLVKDGCLFVCAALVWWWPRQWRG